MQGQFLIIGSAVVIALIIVIVILHIVKKAEMRYYRNKLKNLEVQRNMVASTPVLVELSKVEPIIKNDKLEEKYSKWQDKFNEATNRPRSAGKTVPEIRDAMVNTMWYKAGVFREEGQLQEAARELAALEKEYEHCYVGDNSHVYNTAFEQYVELGNLLQVSHSIVQGAIARKESRGGHFLLGRKL